MIRSLAWCSLTPGSFACSSRWLSYNFFYSGEAAGFKLEALNKLITVKSLDGKDSLLHFLARLCTPQTSAVGSTSGSTPTSTPAAVAGGNSSGGGFGGSGGPSVAQLAAGLTAGGRESLSTLLRLSLELRGVRDARRVVMSAVTAELSDVRKSLDKLQLQIAANTTVFLLVALRFESDLCFACFELIVISFLLSLMRGRWYPAC